MEEIRKTRMWDELPSFHMELGMRVEKSVRLSTHPFNHLSISDPLSALSLQIGMCPGE